jgi:hypothetical protein
MQNAGLLLKLARYQEYNCTSSNAAACSFFATGNMLRTEDEYVRTRQQFRSLDCLGIRRRETKVFQEGVSIAKIAAHAALIRGLYNT